MSDDPALKGFTDLEQPYPGRRKPVNRDPKTQVPDDSDLWDARPVKTKYTVNGIEPEFFYISALATALGCSVQSIRLWEDKGLLPNTPYRAPKTRGKPQAAGSHKGRRLWTREQIEGIIRLARKHRVILNKATPTPAFAKDVARMFNELFE